MQDRTFPHFLQQLHSVMNMLLKFIIEVGLDAQQQMFYAIETMPLDAASGLIWVENQVSLGANETIMGRERFEQWIYDHAFVEIKHFHGDNGIFSSEEYRDDCADKMQSQSFSGVGAQHQNSKAERAIQTIMYMARIFKGGDGNMVSVLASWQR